MYARDSFELSRRTSAAPRESQNARFLSPLFSHTSPHSRPYPLSIDTLPKNTRGGYGKRLCNNLNSKDLNGIDRIVTQIEWVRASPYTQGVLGETGDLGADQSASFRFQPPPSAL
jgi:hypothetical protein